MRGLRLLFVVVPGLSCPSVWDLPKAGNQTCVPFTGRRILNHWTTRKAPAIFSAVNTAPMVDFRLLVKSLRAHLERAVYI